MINEDLITVQTWLDYACVAQPKCDKHSPYIVVQNSIWSHEVRNRGHMHTVHETALCFSCNLHVHTIIIIAVFKCTIIVFVCIHMHTCRDFLFTCSVELGETVSFKRLRTLPHPYCIGTIVYLFTICIIITYCRYTV